MCGKCTPVEIEVETEIETEIEIEIEIEIVSLRRFHQDSICGAAAGGV